MLAVVPEDHTVLGLAISRWWCVRRVRPPRPIVAIPPRAGLWEVSARQIGRAPDGRCWVHVSDRGSDMFTYLVACLDLGKHFVVRAYQNRVVRTDSQAEETRHLIDMARSWSPHPAGNATVAVPARPGQPARQAQTVLQFAAVTIAGSSHVRADLRDHAPLDLWVLRVWEPTPPAASKPLGGPPHGPADHDVDDARQTIAWYRLRWLVEDYHMCLKTGCRVEQSQLDDRADLERLLGFAAPVAVRLLQLRQYARQSPEVPATTVVEPLVVEVHPSANDRWPIR